MHHVERREGSGPTTARQPGHQGAKSSPKDGKHEVSIGKMVVRTSPVDAVRGFFDLCNDERVKRRQADTPAFNSDNTDTDTWDK